MRDDAANSGLLYGISELAEMFNITPRAIRFYEDKGLLKPQRVGGQRIFNEVDRTRLGLILRAKSIGTSLADIKTFLDLYGREGEGRVRQLEFVIGMVTQEIERLETKRNDIDQTLKELRVILDGSNERLARKLSAEGD
jgi:DNA-binding transcriptional MerR regulator